MTAKSWKTISVPLCYVSQPLPVCLRTQHFLFLFYILWRLTNQKVKHISSKQNPKQVKESFNPQIVFLAVLRVLHVILRYQDAPEVLLRGLWRPCTPSLTLQKYLLNANTYANLYLHLWNALRGCNTTPSHFEVRLSAQSRQ